MPKLISIQEICRPCNEMVDTKIAEFWEYDHLFYVLPSGKEVQKYTFYVPVWCRECEDFTLAYKPLDLDYVKDDLRDKLAKLEDFTRPMRFKIFTRFTRLGKIELSNQTNRIKYLEAVLEFASCRVDYHTASCTRCSSSNIDCRWWNNRNQENHGVSLSLGPTKKHSCGSETSYVVSEGRFSWSRNKRPKRQYFDCADKEIEV